MTDVADLLTWITVFATPWQQVVQVAGVGTIARLAGLAAFGVGLSRWPGAALCGRRPYSTSWPRPSWCGVA